MLNKLRKSIANLISKDRNSSRLSTQFLRNGGRPMDSSWSNVVISDEDLYTGYSYAAIRNRANTVARIASNNLRTESNGDNTLDHPYLSILDASPSFTNYQLWTTISTYLDLEGIFYLMAIRNFNEGRYGTIQEFKLLNPYKIKRVIDKNSLTEDGYNIVGYIESKDGLTRDIPKEMIIEIRELNPFGDDPTSMTDAAKESQFTLKTAGDYTRNALKNNINAPGVMSTDVILGDTDFKNFTERVKNHVKGEPIFANGKGAISWESMQTNLKDSGLAEINSMNRDMLLSTSGVSKTILGIEESGTTRETAKVQKDLYIESQIIPRIQMIIDPLNQDFRNNYPDQFKSFRPMLVVDNPSATDHLADQIEIDVIAKRADTYDKLLMAGYDSETVAKFISGEIEIDKLGEPVRPEETIIDEPIINKVEDKVENEQPTKRGMIAQQQSSLQNAVTNIDQRVVADVLTKVTEKFKNSTYEVEADVIAKKDKDESVNELALVLTGFYGIMLMLKGGETMRTRTGQYAMGGIFNIDSKIKKYIKKVSDKVAQSHIDTIVDDLLQTVRQTALTEGAGINEITRAIRKKYNQTITENRAKTIARTETNRAFTRAQYEADVQFIKQNNLESRAFKKWMTRSDNPCAFCQQLASEPAIPFVKNFRNLDDNITADGKDLKVGFESLEAGNAHPNCSCEYQLVIEPAKNNLDLEELKARYEEMDKRSLEAKQLIEEIKSESAKFLIAKQDVELKKKEMQELTTEIENLL